MFTESRVTNAFVYKYSAFYAETNKGKETVSTYHTAP